MRRIGFIGIFLTCLTIAFAIAVYFRIRKYSDVRMEDSRPRLSVMETTPPTVTTDSGGPLSSMSTGTIVETKAATTPREKLREELLRAPLPKTSVQPVATPIPKSPTPQPRPPSPPKVVAPPQPRSGQASASSQSQAPQPQIPKDPNSDTLPPQLFSIEFDPPAIHDGEESRVIMTARDDMSGIRGISGTIVSPNGKALQGFAGQREADTDRYVGRVTIPKNGEEGLWRVNVITMSDNASNAVTLNLAQGTLHTNAALRVMSSGSDSTPPVLKSVRADKRSMHIGEQNPIYIEAQDDKSGVNLVSAVFQSPSKRARIGAGCRRSEGDMWQCDLSLPSCIDCGDWQLEQVTLQDKANNLATYRLDNPIVASLKINIGGDACDNEAPRLHGIVLDQTVVALSRDATFVTVTITATDDACGVEGASGQYSGPMTGTGGFFPFQKSGDEQTLTGRIPLDPRAPRGTWHITSIQLTDKGHNLRVYYQNDPLLANATFQVR